MIIKKRISFISSLILFVLIIDYTLIFAQVHYLQTPIGSPVTGTISKKGLLGYAAGNGTLYEINPGASVYIQSSRSTKLLQGFKAKAGSYFHAGSSLEFQGTSGNNYKMPRHILEGYLSRYITMQNFADNVDDVDVFEADPGNIPISQDNWQQQDQINDDIRMLTTIGAKFIGNAAGIWGTDEDVAKYPNSNEDEVRFNRATKTAEELHLRDPEIILQAAIFEYVNSWQLNSFHLEIPSYVFSNYNVTPLEKKSLNINTSQNYVFTHSNIVYDLPSPLGPNLINVPDINKIECQLYFFYRAIRYIDAGYESLHFGRMLDMMSINDDGTQNHQSFIRLLNHIRAYANVHARRNFILITSHGRNFTDQYGLRIDGIRDFYTEPVRVIPDASSVNNYNNGSSIISAGGSAIYGFTGYDTDLPYVVELDNDGLLYCDYGPTSTHYASWHIWGWDEITWFAMQGRTFLNNQGDDWELDGDDINVRNNWLEYAYEKVRCLDNNGFLGMPGRRGISPSRYYENISSCTLPKYRVPSHEEEMINNSPRPYYRANTGHYNQEEKIKELWSQKEYLLTGVNCSSLPRPSNSLAVERNVLYEKKLQVFPNPFNGLLYLKLTAGNTADEIVDLNLYDLTGRNISSSKLNTRQLNKSQLLDYSMIENGMYVLKIKSASIQQTVKLIKH